MDVGESKLLLQLGGLVAATAVAWGVTKTTVKSIVEQQNKDSGELPSLNSRMDAVEATEAVPRLTSIIVHVSRPTPPLG